MMIESIEYVLLNLLFNASEKWIANEVGSGRRKKRNEVVHKWVHFSHDLFTEKLFIATR